MRIFLQYTQLGKWSIVPLFRKRFQNTDEGEFTDLQVRNLTEDGLPAIIVAYNSVHAGANRARWKEDFLLLYEGNILLIHC